MSIDEHGFLGREAQRWKNECRRKNDRWLSLAEDLNTVAQSFKYQLSPRDVRGLYCLTLLIRALSAYQAVIILIARGLESEAQVVLRNLLEVFFQFRAITEDPTTVQDLINADDAYRLKMYRISRQSDRTPLARLREIATDDRVEELEKRVAQHGTKEIRIEELAKRGRVHEYYDTAYRALSLPGHVNPRDLQQHLVTGENGSMHNLKWGPSDENLAGVVGSAIELLLTCLRDTGTILGCDPILSTVQRRFDDLRKELLCD